LPGASDWVRNTTAAISRGDRGALAVFYEAWFEPCYSLARAITRRDEALCLDIVQETMLRVIRHMRPLETHSELSAWMTRAVHTAAIDLLRRESRRLRREMTRGTEGVSDLVSTVDERIAWLQDRVAELPESDRAMVGLRFAHGRSLEAVGVAAGISGDAAHGRIRRILSRLRRSWKEVSDER
jgi:RNA polymerase sigma factor (sigma-70 family)